VALDERAFFSDRNETRPARSTCNRCRRTNEYTVRWVRRVKKDRLPSGADEVDRAKFAKLRDHLIRVPVPGRPLPHPGRASPANPADILES
jgi:hypothetical protein